MDDRQTVVWSMADFEALYGPRPDLSKALRAYGLREPPTWRQRLLRRLLRRHDEAPVVWRVMGPR